MHHIALNRSGPNDCYFDHDVVETFRFHSRQRGHLRAALDLKHANGVGVLHDLEGPLVLVWNVSDLMWASRLATQLSFVLHDRHHAQAYQDKLDEAKLYATALGHVMHDT